MKLTPEQQAATNRIIDDYVQIGLSTQPINRDVATEATLSLYDVLESERPRVILHVQSPFASAIGGLLLERMLDRCSYPWDAWDGQAMQHALDEYVDELTGQMSGMDAETFLAILRDAAMQIQHQIPTLERWSICTAGMAWNCLRASEIATSEDALVTWKKKAPTLKEALLRRLTRDKGRTDDLFSRHRTTALVTTPIHSALDGMNNTTASSIRLNLLTRSFRDHDEDLCRSHTLAMLAGASWLTNSAIQRGTMNRPKLFHAIKHMVSQAGHVFMTPRGNGVAISDRPAEIHLDAQQRPHRLDGPAMLYRDGWAVYAIHGVPVPREVIEQASSITVKRIDEETNVEVRRVLIERYGLDRYMKDSQAELLHRDTTGLLYRKQVAGDEAIVMIRVLNST